MLTSLFRGDRCKTLAGKPKLFFIQVIIQSGQVARCVIAGYTEVDEMLHCVYMYRVARKKI